MLVNSENPLVYLVIISYNCKGALLRLLTSLNTSTYQNQKVLVVDNGSRDGTVAAVKEAFPGHSIVANQSNMGFSRGCNIGIQKAIAKKADFVMLLNQDTSVHPCLIERLVAAMSTRPSAACIGPKTYFLDHKPSKCRRILYAGAWKGLFPLVQKTRGIGCCDNGQFDKPCLVDYVWGHGMFVRASVFAKAGLFDTSLFIQFSKSYSFSRESGKSGCPGNSSFPSRWAFFSASTNMPR